jgi:catechol 2,3-dioxygenase-like lactoylglutathione lyase family enzyme
VANACSHIGLCVTDLERSRRFYQEVFGFRLAFDLRTEGPETPKLLRLDAPLVLDAVYLALDGLLLELLYFERPTSPPAQERALNQPGLTHISLFVEDVDAVVEAVPQYGGRVRDDTNIGVALFVEDPDGQGIEIIGPTGQFRAMRDQSLRKLAD